jgi:hypothetical protein
MQPARGGLPAAAVSLDQLQANSSMQQGYDLLSTPYGGNF